MRILIVKMSSLGDIIHAFPVLEYLKQHYPQAQIDWVVEKPFAELVRAHPLLDRVLCVQTKKWRKEFLKSQTYREILNFRKELRKESYAMVFDLQGNIKSAFVTNCALSPLKIGFDSATVPEWPNIFATNKRYNPPQGQNIREDYLFLAQSVIGDFSPAKKTGVNLKLTSDEQKQLQPVLENFQSEKKLKVMVCPGSNWTNKQLTKDTLVDFLQCFENEMEAHFFFVWGNQAEKDLANTLIPFLKQQCSVVDRLSLGVLQNLMTYMDLVLAMDSLPLHLAGTTATPTYSVFGASSSKKYKPFGDQHKAFQGSCPFEKSFNKRCDILRTCKSGGCIKDLEGRQLYKDFLCWWNTRSKVS